MLFDTQVPSTLKTAQQWFASIITSPIDENNKSNPITPRGNSLIEEAKFYIAPSPTLLPHQRIELYNQQYWWRLLTTMQESFPLVTRLFGYRDFNQTIAIPYLEKYPPYSWSLNSLGDRLVKWVEEEYHAEDKQLILDSAKVDSAFNTIFTAVKLPPIDADTLPKSGDISSLLNCKLYLQPFVEIFSLNYDLLEFRKEFLKKDVDHWVENDFLDLPKDKQYFFALYRTKKNDIHWREINAAEYFFLSKFQKGMSVEEVCLSLETESKDLYSEAVAHIALWFQEWIVRQWLSLTPV